MRSLTFGSQKTLALTVSGLLIFALVLYFEKTKKSFDSILVETNLEQRSRTAFNFVCNLQSFSASGARREANCGSEFGFDFGLNSCLLHLAMGAMRAARLNQTINGEDAGNEFQTMTRNKSRKSAKLALKWFHSGKGSQSFFLHLLKTSSTSSYFLLLKWVQFSFKYLFCIELLPADWPVDR